MKRSHIEHLKEAATRCFEAHGWALPPEPKWDVTDFGLGDWRRFGLVLLNLAEESEYCEKLMYARQGMVTPAHTHRLKKEDIICRWGELRIRVWSGLPSNAGDSPVSLKRNGLSITLASRAELVLQPGERVTLLPGVFHEFEPASPECIIGEVSTANDDVNDNVFVDPDVGRFPQVEDE